MRAAQYGHTECIEVLLRNGARCDVRNADGKTAADMADEAGYHDLASHMKFLCS
jgi:ankyrin repeat protein